MSNLKLELKGLDKLTKRLDAKAKAAVQEVQMALEEGSQLIKNEIIMQMEHHTSSGKTYKRTKSGKTHTSSAPGSAPNIDLGTLVGSIDYKRIGQFAYEIGSYGVIYAKYLERGTSRMQKRPWLLPAFKKESPTIYAKIVKGINMGLTR